MPPRGGGQGGVHCHLCCHRPGVSRVHAQSGARVEAVPSEPECKGAQHHQGQVVAFELLRVLEATLARAKHNGACQSTHTARQVHNGAAREVHVALVFDEAADNLTSRTAHTNQHSRSLRLLACMSH